MIELRNHPIMNYLRSKLNCFEMKISEILLELENLAKKHSRNTCVKIGSHSHNGYVCKLHSWRGDYKCLAIGISRGVKYPLRSLIKTLKFTLRRPLIGYKGGEYQMTKDTDVFRANYADASGVSIKNVNFIKDGNFILLET